MSNADVFALYIIRRTSDANYSSADLKKDCDTLVAHATRPSPDSCVDCIAALNEKRETLPEVVNATIEWLQAGVDHPVCGSNSSGAFYFSRGSCEDTNASDFGTNVNTEADSTLVTPATDTLDRIALETRATALRRRSSVDSLE